MIRRGTFESGKSAGLYESKKVKRYRSAFTTSQINYLEKQFEKCPYIGSGDRKELANLLNIPEKAIKIWFQNRRMKEKKEINNVEYNIEGHNNIANDMKFAKDSLINAHSSQSANDRQNSLQSTLMKHDDTTNFSPYYNNTTFRNPNRNDDLKKEITDNQKGYKFKSGVVNNIKQEVEKPYLLHQNLMKYNLNNKYNNKKFMNYLELHKKSVTKSKITPKTTLKAESTRDRIKTATIPQHQDLPQDLSAHNVSNVIVPQNNPTNVQFNPAYIPFCNTQDVCISAGNVIWKPVNIMPAISSNATVAVPEKQPSENPNNVQECKCNCNCHSRSRLNYDQGNMRSPRLQQQYVIAIPYNNNLNVLR